MNSSVPKRSPVKGRKFWGPKFWDVIHILCSTYEPSQAQALKSFIVGLTLLLPCPTCREHLKENLKKYPIDGYLRNNHDTFFWSYMIHDAVNQQCNSRIHSEDGEDVEKISPPFDEIKRYYFTALGEECKMCQM
jgi:hypothetical protein